MSELRYNNKRIYYEIYGDGEPLILLNGIMMSHLSWKAFIPELSKNKKLILFDFLDQGKSDKMEGIKYGHELQVEALKALINHMNIKKADIVGISYGGEIAMQFAIKYKELVGKLILFNTASYTTPWLRDIGRGWINAAKTYDPETFYNVSIPYIYSPLFYTENNEWMEKRRKILYNVFNRDFLNSMIRLTKSSEGYEIRSMLREIKAETLIVGAEYDYITPLIEQEYINENIKGSKFLVIKNCGHASMYEKPNEFILLVNGFLNIEKSLLIV
ncbi:alpha/beta fold hydrolase [Maledivibacter halophilus]|uniref:Pimeloyl-ACP methyl ester carboxylesterase n=1 Tax=Maledivibacter halophilus TaxID=36842 RepID=A0A1T5J9C8_9FIRM|nr:alpha/beta hydrolase [Maledivibacter halophilus]SKC48147.1 Pimeloyl-ACP methyl ester carboxylesterase [Maledivibacter halophilus]